ILTRPPFLWPPPGEHSGPYYLGYRSGFLAAPVIDIPKPSSWRENPSLQKFVGASRWLVACRGVAWLFTACISDRDKFCHSPRGLDMVQTCQLIGGRWLRSALFF